MLVVYDNLHTQQIRNKSNEWSLRLSGHLLPVCGWNLHAEHVVGVGIFGQTYSMPPHLCAGQSRV